MRQIAIKVKSIYRRVRMILSWLKNFGIGNTRYMLQEDMRRRRDIYQVWKCDAKILRETKNEYEKSGIYIQVISVPNDENRVTNWNRKIEEGKAQYYLCKTDDIMLSDIAKWAFAKKIQSSNAEILFCDERVENAYIYKPDFGIDTALAQNYFGNVICISKKIWTALGRFDERIPYAAFYNSVIQCYDLLGENAIGHVRKALSWKRELNVSCDNDLIQKQEIIAIKEHLDRQDCAANVLNVSQRLYQINYELREHPKVSIIIPNKDNICILRQCIESIIKKSTYDNYEIVIVENNSTNKETFEYYKSISKNAKEDELSEVVQPEIHVVKCVTDWNYSYINNYGVLHANGEYIILLNNDTEVIAPDWIEQMLQYAQQKEIGVVGAKLYYPDGTIQHGGVTLGIRGVAGHAFHGWSGDAYGYMNRLITVQNLTAVTAACLMISKRVFEKIGGLDEKFKVAFNDTDLCMRVRKAGYRVVYNPKVELYHHESKSRGNDEQSPEKLRRFNSESMRFQRLYCKELLKGDMYYNDNLKVDNDDFEIREDRI